VSKLDGQDASAQRSARNALAAPTLRCDCRIRWFALAGESFPSRNHRKEKRQQTRITGSGDRQFRPLGPTPPRICRRLHARRCPVAFLESLARDPSLPGRLPCSLSRPHRDRARSSSLEILAQTIFWLEIRIARRVHRRVHLVSLV